MRSARQRLSANKRTPHQSRTGGLGCHPTRIGSRVHKSLQRSKLDKTTLKKHEENLPSNPCPTQVHQVSLLYHFFCFRLIFSDTHVWEKRNGPGSFCCRATTAKASDTNRAVFQHRETVRHRFPCSVSLIMFFLHVRSLHSPIPKHQTRKQIKLTVP